MKRALARATIQRFPALEYPYTRERKGCARLVVYMHTFNVAGNRGTPLLWLESKRIYRAVLPPAYTYDVISLHRPFNAAFMIMLSIARLRESVATVHRLFTTRVHALTCLHEHLFLLFVYGSIVLSSSRQYTLSTDKAVHVVFSEDPCPKILNPLNTR